MGSGTFLFVGPHSKPFRPSPAKMSTLEQLLVFNSPQRIDIANFQTILGVSVTRVLPLQVATFTTCLYYLRIYLGQVDIFKRK
jgi:hypothetical protein